MNGTTLRFEVAWGGLQLLAAMDPKVIHKTTGISEEDFLYLTGKAPWIAAERARVTRSLEAIVSSGLDVLGIARINPPAEYIAAAIVCYANPVNVHTACRWMERRQAANSILGQREMDEHVNPDVVFALCLELYSAEGAKATKAAFDKKVAALLKKTPETV